MEGAPIWCPKVRLGGVAVLARSFIWGGVPNGGGSHQVSKSAFRRCCSDSAKFHLGGGPPPNGGGPHLVSKSAFRRCCSASAKFHLGGPPPQIKLRARILTPPKRAFAHQMGGPLHLGGGAQMKLRASTVTPLKRTLGHRQEYLFHPRRGAVARHGGSAARRFGGEHYCS